MAVEVKIGIADSPRELSVQSKLSHDEAYAAVEEAISGKSDVLSLTDDKGSRFVVPIARIAYVEIGSTEARKVGFGT